MEIPIGPHPSRDGLRGPGQGFLDDLHRDGPPSSWEHEGSVVCAAQASTQSPGEKKRPGQICQPRERRQPTGRRTSQSPDPQGVGVRPFPRLPGERPSLSVPTGLRFGLRGGLPWSLEGQQEKQQCWAVRQPLRRLHPCLQEDRLQVSPYALPELMRICAWDRRMGRPVHPRWTEKHLQDLVHVGKILRELDCVPMQDKNQVHLQSGSCLRALLRQVPR